MGHGGLTVKMAGHLADAIRGLLTVIDQDGDAGKLAAVRAVLAVFDWEFHDRQMALEHIERIVNGGAR